MLDFIVGTLNLFGDPLALILFVFAMLSGLGFGAVPGLSSMTLAAVFLPYTAFITSSQAIAFYGALYVAGVYGGAITSILFNIPGSVENAPTTFDGYPMAKKGEAGRAIGLAVCSSALGGVFSCILMMAATMTIARFAIRAFSSIEIACVVFFAVTIIAGLGAKSFWKGWISVLLGLFIGTVGMDPVSGVQRYAFGSHYLMAGINFIAVILGFFAITEIFMQSKAISVGKFEAPKPSINTTTLKEVFKLKFTILRSWIIGFFCGIIPGVGSALASFLSYSEAKRWSKNPENFGKGEPRGVVAAETANNSAAAGSMIPLLALGLPGGGFTAIMVGVLTIHDLEPGPLVMIQAHDMVWVLFAAMFWASVAVLFVSFLEAKIIVKLLNIPFPIIGTFIIVFSTMGAFAIRNNILDVWTMFIAGLVGVFLRKYGYSLPAIIMGIVLGQIGEAAFRQAIVILELNYWEFFTRPVSLIFVLAGLVTIVVSIALDLKKQFSRSSV